MSTRASNRRIAGGTATHHEQSPGGVGTSTRPRALRACAVTLLLALAGCGPGGGEPGGATPAPAVTQAATPTATPTEPAPSPSASPSAPTAAADPHPAADDLVLSPAGLGPLTVGMPAESNPGAAMISWDPEHCAALAEEGDDPGRWVAEGYGSATRADGTETEPLFGIATDDSGAVAWIDVYGTAPRTPEGIGVGSTLEDVLAAYPDLSEPFAGALSEVRGITRPEGILVLETTLGDPELPDGTVVLARVLAPGSDPAFATWRTDWTAGGCL
jgi:hypothetical protein